jgi:hypothetical protein
MRREVHSAANRTKTPVNCEWRLQLWSPFLKQSVCSFLNLQAPRPLLVVIGKFTMLSKSTRLILHCISQTIQLEHNLTTNTALADGRVHHEYRRLGCDLQESPYRFFPDSLLTDHQRCRHLHQYTSVLDGAVYTFLQGYVHISFWQGSVNITFDHMILQGYVPISFDRNVYTQILDRAVWTSVCDWAVKISFRQGCVHISVFCLKLDPPHSFISTH